MDVPISLAVLLAGGMSLFETIQGGAHAYFDSAVTLLFFLLIGRYLDRRARGQARSAAGRLVALQASGVTVLDAQGRQPRSCRPNAGAVRCHRAGRGRRAHRGRRHGHRGPLRRGRQHHHRRDPAGRGRSGDRVFAGAVNLGGALTDQGQRRRRGHAAERDRATHGARRAAQGPLRRARRPRRAALCPGGPRWWRSSP